MNLEKLAEKNPFDLIFTMFAENLQKFKNQKSFKSFFFYHLLSQQ